MPDQSAPHVCLLIDFENLVLGLQQMVPGDLIDELDVSLLFRIAEEHGQVALANAYADWRNSRFNQFQLDLDRQGIELVHVLGRGYKNAVDVKLAVDAIETLWTLPHIQTFVVVSGDRDFIHILKTLRRHGKKIVGVAPDVSVSDDFASLCDSFVKYSALKRTYSETGGASPAVASPERGHFEHALAGLLAKSSLQGMKGATLKQLLKRELGQTFDESEYGYAKFSELLRSLPHLARIEVPATGDIVVYPADVAQRRQDAVARPALSAGGGNAAQIESMLRDYRFQPNAGRRRALLRLMFEAMQAAETFTQDDIVRRVLESDLDSTLSATAMSKYFVILYQSQAFLILPDQEGIPVRLRRLRLKPRFAAAEDIIRAYEYSIVLKIRALAPELDPVRLAGVLGLDPDIPVEMAYCEGLHRQARAQSAPAPPEA